MKTITRQSLAQLIRFIFVGLITNIVGYFLYLVLTGIGGEPKIVMTNLYILGILLSFILNRSLTFAYKGRTSTTLKRFLIAYTIGYILNLAGLVIGVDLLKYPHQIVQAIMIIFLTGILFLMQKCWVFVPNMESR
jgi:putative flippase GtrA